MIFDWLNGPPIDGTTSKRLMREFAQIAKDAWGAYERCAIQQTSPEEITRRCLDGVRSSRAPSEVLPQAYCQLAYDLVITSGLYPKAHTTKAPASTAERIRFTQECQQIKNIAMNAKEEIDRAVKITSLILRILGDALGTGYFTETDGLSFEVAVSEVMLSASPLVQHLLDVTGDLDPRDPLFYQLRQALDNNAKQSAGIATDQPWPTGKSATLQFRRDTQRTGGIDLSPDYLTGTPFARFLKTKTSLHVSTQLRNEHTHFLAPSGTGKTQALEYFIQHDLQAVVRGERSVFVMESEGDLIHRLARHPLFDRNNPNNIADRLYLIDPETPNSMPTFSFFELTNKPLRSMRPDEREQVSNQIVDLYRYVFRALRGGDLTESQGYIFNYLVRMLIWVDGATIHTLLECLQDKELAIRLSVHAPDKIQSFFQTTYGNQKYSARRTEVFQRLDSFTSSAAAFTRMISGQKNNFDLLRAINSGSVILINTSKDKLGGENAQIFGRFMIALLRLLSLSRSKQDILCFAYLDEAHEYLDEKARQMFEQVRKRKIGLVVAHQELSQLSPELRKSIKTNTQTVFSGKGDDTDRQVMAKNMDTSPEMFKRLVKRDYIDTEMVFWGRGVTHNGAVKVTIPFGTLDKVGLVDAYPAGRWPEETEVIERVTNPPSSVGDGQSRVTFTISEPQAGRGGTQHREIQEMIKGIGHDLGFGVSIEAKCQNSDGAIDVLLTGEKTNIAVEVSITTSPEHELENLKKCLKEPVDLVLCISPNDPHRVTIQNLCLEQLPHTQAHKIKYLRPNALAAYLDQFDERETTLIRGYEVVVRTAPSDPEDVAYREMRINQVLRDQ